MTTLADLTPEQRAQCVGMWCDYYDGDGVKPAIIVEVSITEPEWCMVYWQQFREIRHPLGHDVVPRYDLPRAWNPDGTPPRGEWETAKTKIIPNENARYDRATNTITGDAIADLEHEPKSAHDIRRFVGEWELTE